MAGGGGERRAAGDRFLGRTQHRPLSAATSHIHRTAGGNAHRLADGMGETGHTAHRGHLGADVKKWGRSGAVSPRKVLLSC